MYSKLKGIKKGYQPRTLFCKDRNDKLIGGHANVTDRWAEYFEELLNRQSNDEREIQHNHNDYDVNEENCEPPTIEEVRDAIAKLRNGKAPGEDLISAELLKYGGEKLVTNVT